MTKGCSTMEHNESLNDVETSNLARRFLIEDYALRYQMSLQMAENRIAANNVAVVPRTRHESRTRPKDNLGGMRELRSRSVDSYNGRRRSVNSEVEDMAVDVGVQERLEERTRVGSSKDRRGNGFPAGSREDLAVFHLEGHPYRIGHPQVSSNFIHTATTTPKIGVNFGGRPHEYRENYRNHSHQAHSAPVYNSFTSWPYYPSLGYTPYVSSTAARGYPIPGTDKDSGFSYSSVRDLPAQSARDARVEEHVSRATSPSESEGACPSSFEEGNRVVISSEGKSLFTVKRVDDEDLVKSNEIFSTSLGISKTSDEKDISYVNSCRPSVLVMQWSADDSPRSSICDDVSSSVTERRSPEFSRHDQRVPSSEHCKCDDDHNTTDSDSTTTPPASPSAISSDERFYSDSPRDDDSNQDKPHKCNICGRAFRKHSALIIHHRVHSGEKPYRCPKCAKNFSISGNLRRHFLIHTGERPYICPECTRAFNNPSHLTRHRRKLHNKLKIGGN